MNFISKFFHEIIFPHCPDCKLDKQDEFACQSCENLKMQLATCNTQINNLIEKLTKHDKEIIESAPPEMSLQRGMMPWAVKRQLLEAEDRAKASAMRKAGRPDSAVDALEKELDIETGVKGDR